VAFPLAPVYISRRLALYQARIADRVQAADSLIVYETTGEHLVDWASGLRLDWWSVSKPKEKLRRTLAADLR
jgi:hypothetical protein